MALKPLSETSIQKAIMQYLKLRGVFHFRVNTGGVLRNGKWCPSPNVTKGTPDIVALGGYERAGINYARFIGIEVKSAKGKLSPDQEAFKASVEKAGGLYVVARSVADVQAVFE